MIVIGPPIKDVALLRKCLLESAKDAALVAEFDRLTGSDLSKNRAPIEQLIDEQTGYFEESARMFYGFVIVAVYWPMQNAADAAERAQKEMTDATPKGC
jgi:hypothetical protein